MLVIYQETLSGLESFSGHCDSRVEKGGALPSADGLPAILSSPCLRGCCMGTLYFIFVRLKASSNAISGHHLYLRVDLSKGTYYSRDFIFKAGLSELHFALSAGR